MKAKVKSITKFSHDTADFFAGAHSVSGYSIDVEWFESIEGFFYVGNAWRGVPKAGETATINFAGYTSEAEALFELQYHVETPNVEAVRKSETWLARTKYYSQDWDEFETEEAAREAAYNPSAVKKGEITYSPVCFLSEIINLTQHGATPEQIAAGVVEPYLLPLEGEISPEEVKRNVCACLTFLSIPSIEEIEERAKSLAAIARWHGVKRAMIGGAPFLMSALERELKHHGISPVYAFSQRESVEIQQTDGSVVKTNVFKHVGFVGV